MMISPSQRSYYSPSLKGDVFVWVPSKKDDRVPLLRETFTELRRYLIKNNEAFRNDWRMLDMEDVAQLIRIDKIAPWITGPIVLPPEGNKVRVISRPKVAHLWCDGVADLENEWQPDYQILILNKKH